MLRVALTALVLAGRLTGPAVQGTVRAGPSGEPLPAVLVEVVDGGLRTRSDSAGAYVLCQVAPGPHQVRFSRLGYEPLIVDVLVPADSSVRLDVELTAHPVEVAPIEVVALAGTPLGDRAPDTSSEQPREIGFRRVTMTDARASPLAADVDVLGTLATLPEVGMRPEFPTSLHVRGGSADQNLILLDGVPIYSPYHAADVFGAINPDAVARVDVHTLAPPARFGGRLSSVIDLSPRRASRQTVEWRGALGPAAVRQTVDGPLPVGRGGFLISGRGTYRDRLGGASTQGVKFGDVLGHVSFDLPNGSLAVMVFRSVNELGFSGYGGGPGTDIGAGGTGQLGDSPDTAPAAAADSVLNRFGWRSHTDALVWRTSPTSRTRLETRLWRAGAGANIQWMTPGGPARLVSALDNVGVSSAVSAPLVAGWAQAGLSAERLVTRYAVSAVRTDSAGSSFSLSSAPTIVAGFVEGRWELGRWGVVTGLRGSLASGRSLDIDPRLSIRLAAGRGITLSAGYAREHQYVQSLRNEESVLDAVFGADLPVAAGARGIPVARSDQLAGAIELGLNGHDRLRVDGYLRWLDGLVLVAPATGEPFATGPVARGSGRADGVGLSYEHLGTRLQALVAGTLELVSRRAGTLTYHPSFQRPWAVTMAIGYRVAERTTLRAALWTGAGRPNTPIAEGFEWQPYSPLGGSTEIAGTPQPLVGPLNAERLPAYARVDVGIRRDWHVPWLGHRGRLSTVASVYNVFGRRNALTYVGIPAARSTLDLLPFAATFGLEWRY